MNTISKLNLLYFIVFIFPGCCAEKLPDNNKLNLIINVVKSYAWINLMPGARHSFHLSGEIKIQNNSDEPITNLKLWQITVYDDSIEVLKFKPLFSNLKDKSVTGFIPKDLKDFSIAAPDKINIDKFRNLKVINLLLKFSSDDKTFDYKIDNVEIERVY